MGYLDSRLRFLLVLTLTVGIGSVAWAEPAGETVDLPFEMQAGPSDDTSVIVEKGDHLWKISSERLGQLLGREAADTEIAPYWWEVIEANQDRLRSGDPDLIYPGETVVLPDSG